MNRITSKRILSATPDMLDEQWPHFEAARDFSNWGELRTLLEAEVAKTPFASVQAGVFLWDCAPGVGAAPDGEHVALEAFWLDRARRRVESRLVTRNMSDEKTADEIADAFLLAELETWDLSDAELMRSWCSGTRRVWVDDICPIAPLVVPDSEPGWFRVWLPPINATVRVRAGAPLWECGGINWWEQNQLYGPYATAFHEWQRRENVLWECALLRQSGVALAETAQ